MLPDLADTIVAVASAPGPGARGIVRLSGKDSFAIAAKLMQTDVPSNQRCCLHGWLRLRSVAVPLPTDIYLWPGPHSYTGQSVVELHTISAPPLLDALVADCLHHGARAAQAGEFTMRAFLAGKLDLTRVEAVLAVIDAGNAAELTRALSQLAGGVSQPLQKLRDDLLNLLADLEAALDFADEDIEFVSQDDTLRRVSVALAHLILLQKQLQERALPARPFRVVLAGRPNAGKSSLFNALAGSAAALVSNIAGTTRDYLVCRLQIEGVTLELVDTAGIDSTEQDNLPLRIGQGLGREQMEQADLVLWCQQAGTRADSASLDARIVRIVSKCDLAPAAADDLATSAHTGAGLDALRGLLVDRARDHARPALAPSLSRCRHHVDTCLTHLRRVHRLVLEEAPAELIALEIRCALDHLGAMVGAVYTDDLLDRIFSRFCIGK